MAGTALLTGEPAPLARTGGVVVYAEESPSRWDDFVNSHPDATSYHVWRWRHVFERAFGHSCEYLAAREQDTIVGVLPLVLFKSYLFGRFMVSLPFVNYGGVLASTPTAARALLAHAASVAAQHRVGHLELRHRTRRFPDLRVKQHKVAMLLRLPSNPGTAWNGLDRKVRNQIRKAERSGLAVTLGGPELLGEFYHVFGQNMRDLGTPVYARRFFEEILHQFPERTRLLVVRRGRQPVAGAISYASGGTFEVPWASSLQEYRQLCPNNVLYWQAIQQAIAGGCQTLDFGRSTPGSGGFFFKKQWGAEPRPLHWEYRLFSRQDLPDQSPNNPKFRAAIAIWRRLPVRVANVLGPWIVRSIP